MGHEHVKRHSLSKNIRVLVLGENVGYGDVLLADKFSLDMAAYVNVFEVRIRHWVLLKVHSNLSVPKHRETRNSLTTSQKTSSLSKKTTNSLTASREHRMPLLRLKRLTQAPQHIIGPPDTDRLPVAVEIVLTGPLDERQDTKDCLASGQLSAQNSTLRQLVLFSRYLDASSFIASSG